MLLGVGAANLTLLDEEDNTYQTRLYVDNALMQSDDNFPLCNPFPRAKRADEIKIVTDEASRLLWHARLGHLNFWSLSEMHKFAEGIPKFKQSHQMENCSTCMVSKLRRSPRGHGTIVDKAEVHGHSKIHLIPQESHVLLVYTVILVT
jgi:hypothetical protein